MVVCMPLYENIPCPVCHVPFGEKDDIVVCPVCGTPHHRACYQQTGHCAHDALHAQGYDFKAEQASGSKAKEAPAGGGTPPFQQDAAPSGDGSAASGESQVCRFCGVSNPAESLFCTRCGRPLQNYGQTPPPGGPFTANPFGVPFGQYDPLGGVPKEDTIEEVPVSEVAAFVQSNSAFYLPVFHRMAKQKKKLSWNWPAFFVPDIWFFFRKNYMAGVIALLLQFGVTVFFNPVVLAVYGIYAENQKATNAELTELLRPYMSQILIYLGILLVLRFVAGLFANLIYKRAVIHRIKDVKETAQGEDYMPRLLQKGGISVSGGLSAILLEYMLPYFFGVLADMVKG